jgi:hypothetical protein
MDAIRELKVRAEILQKRVRAGNPRALARLTVLPQFRRSSDSTLAELGPAVRRSHCLTVAAMELGFADWTQARCALSGEGSVTDFGTLLCPDRCSKHLNLWFRSYDEAATVRQRRNGYLLAHRKHFVVVDRFYIATLGLDPDDPEWEAAGFDWVHPRSRAARTRIYSKLVAALPRDKS